ncbi:cytidine deaminase-like protein [Suillus fuscotomentosus]|uniref:Cytosine deaminase n=3 Tax=Suillus TaxID=5379 RepID=A0A9P7F042_9AGAM|nr:cytidine deaminase-like protein [Suillus plorans]XP_041221938.1 cytidine deaminase-like protein [Suillus fuscotomentosus]XP_041288961.1 cytidine deaminase-like protein [Suillus discolor]KAG1816980.1 cytidine deaminase-like protein [Suillus variegatus]KAG1797420.1 cytidine deaminase-like protein [Suillus plorans]KAG1896362.1 cytidine deaminase-like protein [Suillus fuscotomentosus]KAG2098713.1 cytidine deaminase-like protein [Suillus discolor]
MDGIDKLGLSTALAKARKSYQEGGIPIGAALVYHGSSTDPKDAVVLGCSHNSRIQKSSATLHGEIAALEDAGRLKAQVYRGCTMYTTLSPCIMCTGAIILYKIPRVVIGENENWVGGEELLKSQGVEVIVVDNAECKELMKKFIVEKPEEWNEDIGEIQ